MTNDELYHYGRKGMKWYQNIFGKKEGSSGGTSGKKPEAKPRPKKISEMSDEELKKRLERLDMEKRYKQAMAELSASKKSKIAKWATDVLGEVGTSLAKEYLKNRGKQALNMEKQQPIRTVSKPQQVKKPPEPTKSVERALSGAMVPSGKKYKPKKTPVWSVGTR